MIAAGNRDWLAVYNNVADIYRGETDRAAGTLGASFMDNCLEDLLLTFLVDDPKIREMFDGDRPLATFSARISLAFALGLLPPNVVADLTLIRKIRNHFAHSAVAVAFSEPPVSDWCRAFSMVRRDSEVFAPATAEMAPREQFLVTIACIAHYLQHMLGGVRAGQVARCVAPPLIRLAL